ncbi:putative toxin-antitoxin system toxin component, PIN family [Clostridium sp. UBA1652]|uniref:putative toxin-antitoxin system toxin component, PIN family n=1 Tax=Clostridium sp. UBA1652 TaxID=1946348 RepID=UPI00258046F0|nr:putative toxin-antitoxin system toxin component, PIN family [Clostridium sp. UBA1652]
MRYNKPKVVLDTNIFINGWFYPDKYESCDKIMELIEHRRIQLLFAQDTIGELIYLTKNFCRYNLSDVKDRIEMLKELMELFYYSTSINTSETRNIKIFDSYDEMFVKCAIEGKADYLISDDIRSGMLEIKENFKTMTSTQFIEYFYNSKN